MAALLDVLLVPFTLRSSLDAMVRADSIVRAHEVASRQYLDTLFGEPKRAA